VGDGSVKSMDDSGPPSPERSTNDRTRVKVAGRAAPLVDRLATRKRGEELLKKIYGDECLDNIPAPEVHRQFEAHGLRMSLDSVRRVLGRI